MINAMSSKFFKSALLLLIKKKIVIVMAFLSDGAQAVLNQLKVPDKRVNNKL